MWSLTAKVCQGLSFSSDALLDSMDLFLQSRGDVHALQWLSILLILAHVELVTGELLTIVEKPVSSSSHEGDWARTARSHLISGTSLRQDLAALAGDVAKWTSATGQVSETALIRMDFRASRAPLLQESSAGDGPYVGSPASHAYSWGDFILKRRCGYVAQRVGEASHPGPGGKAAQQRKQMEAFLHGVLGEGGAIRLLVMLFSLLMGNQGGIAGLQQLLRSNGLFAPESDANTASQAAAKPKRKPRKPKSGNAPPLMTQGTAHPSAARTVAVSEGVSGQPKAKAAPKPAPKTAVKPQPTPPAPAGGPTGGVRPTPVLRKDDWSGDLVPYGELADYSGTGPLLVHVSGPEQAAAADLLAAQVAPKCSRSIIWEDREGTVQVPFYVQGRMLPRRVCTIDTTIGSQALPGLRKLTGKTKKIETKTVVLRVIIVKAFLSPQAFQEARANSKKFIQQRCSALKDTWGWAEEKRYGDALVGLIRISDGAAVDSLLQASGQDGVFYEPTAAMQKPAQMQWQAKNPAETDTDYLQRLLKQKGSLGLAVGTRQLAARVTVEAAKAVRAWRLQGTPVHWTQDEVYELITEQTAMSHVEITSKIVRRGRAMWMIRGALAEEFTLVRVEEEGESSQYWITPATATQRRGPASRTPLPAAALSFPRERFKVERAAGGASAGNDGQDSQSGEKEQSVAKKQVMEHRKLPEGCSLDSVPGDGNCLVASLGKGIAFQKQAKAPVPASQLRAELVAYMSRDKQKTRLSEFWDGLDADGKHKLASFDAYLESLQKPGAWMGNLELSSAADLFGLTIYVVPRNVLHPPIKFGVGAYPIALFYSGIHYDYIKPDGVYPSEILNIGKQGVPKGGRGGGDDDARSLGRASSQVTLLTLWTRGSDGGLRVRARVPQERDGPVEDQSQLVRDEAGNGLAADDDGGAAVSRSSGALPFGLSGRGADEVDSPCSLPSIPEPPAPPRLGSRGRLLKPLREKRKSWKCKWCDFQTSSKAWAGNRYNHLLKWHPDRRDEWDDRALLPSQELTEVMEGAQFSWKCKHCNLGIKIDDVQRDKSASYRARMEHRAKAHPAAPKSDFVFAPKQIKNGAAKATQSVVAAATARRLLQLKSQSAGPHDIEMIRIPCSSRAGGRGKRTLRRSQVVLICRTCRNIAASVKKFSDYECFAGSAAGGSSRDSFICRLQRHLGEEHAEDLKQGARRLLELLEPSRKTTESRLKATPASRCSTKRRVENTSIPGPKHSIDVLAWPVPRPRGVQFVVRYGCTVCHLSSAQNISGQTCMPKSTMPNKRRVHIAQMRDFIAQGPASAVAPAKRVLEFFGVPIQPIAAEVPQLELGVDRGGEQDS